MAGSGWPAGAAVVILDRWGSVLLGHEPVVRAPEQPGRWRLPGGVLHDLEAPDEAALRLFEEQTGHLLDTLRLFRVFRGRVDLTAAPVEVLHVYYDDADIDIANLGATSAPAFRYFRPDECRSDAVAAADRAVLEAFITSTAYRAMFH